MKDKQEKLLEALGEISPQFVTEADPYETPSHKLLWRRALLGAAALLMVAATVFSSVMIAKHAKREASSPITLPQYDDSGRQLWIDPRAHKENVGISENAALIWRWEYKEIYEKFTSLTYGGREYGVRYRLYNTASLPSAYLGEKLGSATAKGQDIYEEKQHTIRCEVYEILGLSPEEFLGVRYEGYEDIYVFKAHEYMPPATLGEMLTRYGLPQYIPLSEFYYEQFNENEGHYALTEGADAQIWSLLAQCAATPCISDYTYYRNLEHVSFTLNSLPLGIENLSMTINSEGYLITNLADYGYYFPIGTAAAQQIIDYAMAHKTSAPATNRGYIVGTVVEIGEGYFMLDDSISLKDPDEGIVFTVSTQRLRISRHFAMGGIGVGSTVRLTYDGRIYADNPTVIENPVNLEKCIMVNGSAGNEFLIPE